MIKWIAAIIGFRFGFGGAVIGFVIGSIIEQFIKTGGYAARTQRRAYRRPYQQRVQRSPRDFEVNLLSLSAVVIKADGQVAQSELDYVRKFFVQQFGKTRANASFRIFNDVIKKRSVQPHRICAHMRPRTTPEMRLQILHFLFGVANADGVLHQSELNVLLQISRYLNIHRRDFESIKAMFYKRPGTSNAYKILEVEKNASVGEIKKAYRQMVKKYHPDKLSGMDEAYVKGAQEKFNKVQEAYEEIRKEKGF